MLPDTRLRGRSHYGAAKARNLTPETMTLSQFFLYIQTNCYVGPIQFPIGARIFSTFSTVRVTAPQFCSTFPVKRYGLFRSII